MASSSQPPPSASTTTKLTEPTTPAAAAPTAVVPDRSDVRPLRRPADPAQAARWRFDVLPYLAAVAVTWYVCRPLFSGQFFGDAGDGRWTLSLHEHWYRVWQGQDGIRDLVYYYPLKNTLGTSDAFFVQGQIYAAARFLGSSPTTAWAVTQVAAFLVGALGVAALSTRVLERRWLRIALVVMVCASYPMLIDVIHVQLIGFLATAWVVVGAHDVVTQRHVTRGLVLVLLVPPLIALSSWYAAVLMFVVAAAFLFFLLLLTPFRDVPRRVREAGRSRWNSARRRPTALVWTAAATVLALVGWAAVAWIYLPAKGLLPPPAWAETTIYAPRWSDFGNASGGGGGVWASFYEHVFPPGSVNYEQARGFTPILLVAFMVLGLYQLRRVAVTEAVASDERRPGPRALAAMWLAVLAIFFVIVVDERDLSLFKPIWQLVPGMDSIRAPFRVQILGYALAILVVLRSFELVMSRRHRAGRERKPDGQPGPADRRRPAWWRPVSTVLMGALVVAVFVEMQRPVVAIWGADDLIEPGLAAQLGQVSGRCDAVIVVKDTPKESDVTNEVDAVVFATLSGVPTPQGYSRADPAALPRLQGDGSQLISDMRKLGFAGQVCRVSSAGLQPG